MNLNCSWGNVLELRSCVKVEASVFGSSVSNSRYGLRGRKATLSLNSSISEIRSCVKVEMAIPGSPSPIILMVSVDVKQHLKKEKTHTSGNSELELYYLRAQELCESRGGCPRLPVPNSPYGLCARKATLNLKCWWRNNANTVQKQNVINWCRNKICCNFKLQTIILSIIQNFPWRMNFAV